MHPFHSPESSVQKYTHSTLAHHASQLQSEETKKKKKQKRSLPHVNLLFSQNCICSDMYIYLPLFLFLTSLFS